MTRLWLNEREVAIKNGTTFKVVFENIVLTSSSTYTFEIGIPTIGVNSFLNQWGIRPDTELGETELPARLEVDNMVILSGEATVTGVSESEVKVQILCDNAAYNYRNKAEEKTLNKLDMGAWIENRFPQPDMDWNTNPATKEEGQRQIASIFHGNLPWVAYPTINSNAQCLCNEPFFREGTALQGDFQLTLLSNGTDEKCFTFCVQPYIWAMAEEVARATGLALGREDNALFTDPFLKRLFIVKTTPSFLCNAGLPEWTVNEWWEYLEQAFGVVLEVDSETMGAKLIKRSDFFANGGAEIITNVVDEYTIEPGSEEKQDISSSDVAYSSFDADPYDLLDEDVREAAVTNTDFANGSALQIWGEGVQQYLWERYRNVIFKCADGRCYIVKKSVMDGQDGFVEVDQLGQRDAANGDESNTIDLKFVPARYAEAIAHYELTSSPDYEYHSGDMDIQVLQAPGPQDMATAGQGRSVIDISAILDGEEEIEEDKSEDVIYIAIADNDNFATANASVRQIKSEPYPGNFMAEDPVNVPLGYPLAAIREKTIFPASRYDHLGTYRGDYWRQVFKPGVSLSLRKVTGQTNMASQTIGSSAFIRTDTRYCFKFISDRIPDPKKLFLIRNQRYVCEKLEVSCSSDKGVDRLITGYFYKVDL